MPERINACCSRTDQQAPGQPGEMSRAILESLEALAGRRIKVIHIPGGGSKNQLLNQLVAGATNRTVVAGPSQATAAGNVLVQAMGAGALSGLKGARQMMKRDFEVNAIEPHPTGGWGAACEKVRGLPL